VERFVDTNDEPSPVSARSGGAETFVRLSHAPGEQVSNPARSTVQTDRPNGVWCLPLPRARIRPGAFANGEFAEYARIASVNDRDHEPTWH